MVVSMSHRASAKAIFKIAAEDLTIARALCRGHGVRDRQLIAAPAGDRKGRFDRLADRKNGAVGSIESRQHQSDRSVALTMARQAQRAAVEKVDQRRIAQHEKINPMI